MSYDLGIWYATTPITSLEAGAIYDRIAEDSANAATLLQPAPGIAKLVVDLVETYPQLDDCDEDQAEASPWSGPFEVTDRYLLLSMGYSDAEEVVELLEELCAKHDLVFYDPQREVVTYPPRLAEMPHRRLSTEKGTVIDNPTPDQIAKTLAALKPKGDCFAIFERRDQFYMQTLKEAARQYIIEYRDGSVDKHFQASSKDLAEITAAFQAYAEDRNTWQKQFAWEQLDLTADETSDDEDE